MIEFLVQADKDLFIYLNGLHCSFLDYIMWWFSGKLFWIPLYAAILAYWIKTNKWNTIWLFLFAILVLLANDQVSVAIKFMVERPRPSHNPEFAGVVHHINNYKGGAFGFVSSHAANTFGFAVYALLAIRKNWFSISILAWAAIVSYSRIYLGVHYPGDILFGGFLGVVSGYIIYKMANFSIHKWPIKKDA